MANNNDNDNDSDNIDNDNNNDNNDNGNDDNKNDNNNINDNDDDNDNDNERIMWFIRKKNTNNNKANLRDLIAATGLVILLKLDANRRFFARVKFHGWPRKIIRHVFYTTSSFVYYFISVSEFKLELQSGNTQSGSY